MSTRSKRIAGNSSAPITEEPRRKAPKRQRIEEPENDESEILESQRAAQQQKFSKMLEANFRMENELEATKAKLAAEKEKNKKNNLLLNKHKSQLAKVEKDKKIEINKLTRKQDEEKERLQNLLNHKRSEVEFLEKKLKENREIGNDESSDWKCCEICLEEYSDKLEKTPRLLGCGHTFCLQCIGKIAENSAENTVTCPFDRTEFKMGTKQPKDLPKNFALLNALNTNPIGF